MTEKFIKFKTLMTMQKLEKSNEKGSNIKEISNSKINLKNKNENNMKREKNNIIIELKKEVNQKDKLIALLKAELEQVKSQS